MSARDLFSQDDSPSPRFTFDAEFYNDKKFYDISLPASIIEEIEFSGCTFEKVNFEKAELKKVRFEGCEFKNSSLALMTVKDCRFIDCIFTNCKLIGINWTLADRPVEIKASKSKLDFSVFYGMDLRRIELTDSSAKEVNFEEADLSRGIFTGTDFILAKFKNTNLSMADMREALNYDINPAYNNIKKAKFSLPEALTLLQCFDVEIE